MTGGKTIKTNEQQRRGRTLFLGLCWQRLKFAVAAHGGGHGAPVVWGPDEPGVVVVVAAAVAPVPVGVAPALAGAARAPVVAVPALVGIAAGAPADTAAVGLARNAQSKVTIYLQSLLFDGIINKIISDIKMCYILLKLKNNNRIC